MRWMELLRGVPVRVWVRGPSCPGEPHLTSACSLQRERVLQLVFGSGGRVLLRAFVLLF